MPASMLHFVLANIHATMPATPAACELAVIGGGWAGTYSAWRAALDAGRVDPSNTCLFESSSRWGGRTYTVRGHTGTELEGLNIDIGAYRFAHEQHLPADLLTGPLKLNSGCYLPSCSPEPLDDNLTLYKLMEADGSTAAGYGTALDVMRAQLADANATLLTGHRLIGLYGGTRGSIILEWEGGARTSAAYVMLNLPRHAINALAADSLLFSAASAQTRSLYTCSRELYQKNYTAEASVKVYAVYADAWWGTKLGLWEGEVRDASEPPLYLRYHDGPLRGCPGARAAPGTAPHRNASSASASAGCKGALLVQYSHSDDEGSRYYLPFQADHRTPLEVLDGHDPLAQRIHAKLMRMHAAALQRAGIEPSSVPGPRALVLGFWRHAATETTLPAPDPLSFTTAPGRQLPACVRGLTSPQYSAATRRPTPGWPLMLANNDWWLEESAVDRMAPYWAEVSLRSAERALHDTMNLARPEWLDATYYEQSVLRI